MSASKRFVKKGFTLVEILIVVVILGILAAIVIPQFTSASESAKGSSLSSQLQTIRSQLELYQVEHNGVYPTLGGDDAWDALTKFTQVDGTVVEAKGDDTFGPYLQQPPKNPFNGKSSIGTTADDGWTYNQTTGVLIPNLTDTQAKQAGLSNDVNTQYTKIGGEVGGS
jgi:general secretion pathway protein G